MNIFIGNMSTLPTPDYIRYLRKRAGLTQKELAKRAGVSQSLIARIESGAVDPRLSTLRKILNVLEEVIKEKTKASEVMHSPVIVLQEDDEIERAAKLMWESGISQIPVVDKDGRPIGTVFEKDLVNAFLEYGNNALRIKVTEIMDDVLPIVGPSEDIERVVNLLLQGVPAVLVMDKGKVVGIITKSDIIAKHLIKK